MSAHRRTERHVTESTTDDEPRFVVFGRLWGFALVAHVVGNWTQPDIPTLTGIVNAATGLTGIALAVAPSRRRLILASALVIPSLLAEIPVTGNHWFVAGLVSAAALVTGGRSRAFFPTTRVILLVFYSFAAFAKLNDGFLDPSVSCGVYFVDQWLSGFGLGPIDRESGLAQLAVWGPTLTELAVPVLLLWRPARPFGVLLATFFHTAISYDIHQHFYDFTSVLLPMFFLFAPTEMVERTARAFSRVPSGSRRLLTFLFVASSVFLIAAAVLPPVRITRLLLGTLPFAFWLPFSLWWMATLASSLAPGDRLSFRLPAAGWVVVLLSFANGLTPYTELKTAFGYNMYANLVTADGRSNHWIVRRTFPLRDGQRNPVAIVDTSDDGLGAYVDSGYVVPWPEFRRYLSQRPEVSVSFLRDGVRYDVERVEEDRALSAPVPWWWRFLPLRALDTQRPPRCQANFMPAL